MSMEEGEEVAEALPHTEGLAREEGEGGPEEGERRGEKEFENCVEAVGGGEGDWVPVEDTLGFEGEGRGVEVGLGVPEGGALKVGGADFTDTAELVVTREGEGTREKVGPGVEDAKEEGEEERLSMEGLGEREERREKEGGGEVLVKSDCCGEEEA